MRILQTFGFRAAESPSRAARPSVRFNPAASTLTTRHVWDWLPIQAMPTDALWRDVQESGVPYHPVYDLGSARLSCTFCVLAGAEDLSLGLRLMPDLAQEYLAVEAEVGLSFQPHRRLADLTPAPGPRGFSVRLEHCPTCGVQVLAHHLQERRHCPTHAVTGPWNAAPTTLPLALPCGT